MVRRGRARHPRAAGDHRTFPRPIDLVSQDALATVLAVVGVVIALGSLIILVTRRGLRSWRFGIFFESTKVDEPPAAHEIDEKGQRLTWMREKRQIEHHPDE